MIGFLAFVAAAAIVVPVLLKAARLPDAYPQVLNASKDGE